MRKAGAQRPAQTVGQLIGGLSEERIAFAVKLPTDGPWLWPEVGRDRAIALDQHRVHDGRARGQGPGLFHEPEKANRIFQRAARTGQLELARILSVMVAELAS